jgi:hypothetical protein
MSVMQMRKRRCACAGSKLLRLPCACASCASASRRVDALRVRRGLHALGGAGEQPVVEVGAQLVQRGAGRGLRHAQPLGRPGDVAGLVDLVEHGEPFEIELGHGKGLFQAKDTIIEISNSVYWPPVLRK